MSNELEMEAIDAQTETVATKEPKAKKVVTVEEITGMEAAIEKVKTLPGVTEQYAKVMEMAPYWHDKDVNASKKEEVIEFFGGSDKFKDYIDGDFMKEHQENVGGFSKLNSTLNNIKSFYARRENSGVSKKKVVYEFINIAGESYQVNKSYLAEIATFSKEEKRNLLLEHPDTKKMESIEEL